MVLYSKLKTVLNEKIHFTGVDYGSIWECKDDFYLNEESTVKALYFADILFCGFLPEC